MPDPTTIAPDQQRHEFVVRTPGAWTSAPIPATEPVAIQVDEVLALMAMAGPADRSASTSPATAEPPDLGVDGTVSPVWMFVGLCGDGHLVVGAPDGSERQLGPAHIRVLDAIDGAARPVDLAGTYQLGEPQQVRDLCRDLASAGCLQVDDQGSPDRPDEGLDHTASDDPPVPDSPASARARPAAGRNRSRRSVRGGVPHQLEAPSVREAIDRARGRKAT